MDSYQWLESQGFVPKMRFPSPSWILPPSTVPLQRAHVNGGRSRVQITPLACVRERDPRWMEKLYAMFWEIEQDIPHIDPPVKEPFGGVR